MQNLIMKETQHTPRIHFDYEEKLIKIEGRSYMENTFEFYSPVIKWLESFFNSEINENISVHLDVIYFNSSSSIQFFDIFDIIESAHIKGRNINIKWFYDPENDIALESGEDYKDDFPMLDFQLVKK